ncbi:hypothetical protein GCM10022254_41560 [Actinomadura meridiana]|uniref:WXG100 family type VII secretion target n=1 Tax=Actinomadura meridiana TaxID=559626 RepID=A0ABP8C7G2_9ACTN
MSNINLDYSKIETTAGKLKSAKENIIPMINNLRNDVNTLLGDGMVFDKSSPALRESYDQFNTSLHKAVEGIKSFADMFIQIKNSMEENDTNMAKKIREETNKAGH